MAPFRVETIYVRLAKSTERICFTHKVAVLLMGEIMEGLLTFNRVENVCVFCASIDTIHPFSPVLIQSNMHFPYMRMGEG